MKYELIVGLEIHAQLNTKTKAFCRCPNRYGDSPNTLVCPTCLGLPGALPVLNSEVVKKATLLALALNAKIHEHSKFDRKNYFYPDLPKGYQISQYDKPFSTNGFVEISLTHDTVKRINITRAHIEEDAGKSMHMPDGTTIVDMNRCGVPLVEIVSEPEMRSSEEAGVYLTTIRRLLRFAGVCDGNMEQGSLRCDANVSVRPFGQELLNERTEMKNLNSISGLMRAVRMEYDRQVAIYETGGIIHRETLLWDDVAGELRRMRKKEGSDDYRYFPEPDLLELQISVDYIHQIKSRLPELPQQRRKRYAEEFKLNDEALAVLISDRAIGDYFEELLSHNIDPNNAAKWIQGDVQRAMNENGWTIENFPISPEGLAELIKAIEKETISFSKAKQLFREMLPKTYTHQASGGIKISGGAVIKFIQSEGASQISDTSEIKNVIQTILEKYPDEISKYKSGKKNLYGFFVGEAMKATSGRANPKIVNTLLQELLDSPK